MDVATVITRNRVAHARVLATSFREHHPDARVVVLCLDDPDRQLDHTDEPFDVVHLQDLPIDDVDGMVLRYEAFELANALKPAIVRHALERGEPVAYLDVDMVVYRRLEAMERALADHQLVLTPHITTPLPRDGREPTERAFLVAGAYNGGCLGFAPGDVTDRMLDWWSHHLRNDSRVAPADGLMVDQAWLDLVPTLFPATHVLDAPGIDVAYWNLPARPLARTDDGWTVGGAPLGLFHFSGFDPTRPRRLSAYDARYARLAPGDPVAELCADYAQRLDAAGLAAARRVEYGYALTPGGLRMTPFLRELLDDERAPRRWFDGDGEQAALAWWNGPAERGGDHGVTRLLAALHASRPDLEQAFPDLDTHDGWRLRSWALEHGGELLPSQLLPRQTTDSAHAGPPSRPAGLQEHEPGQPLPVARGEAVVCIPVYGAADLFVRCMRSVLTHTPADVLIVVADDASPDPRIRTFLEELNEAGLLHHHVRYMRQPQNVGFVENVNATFETAAPADVIILNSDCVVAASWFQELRTAAYADSNVATATALANHATILSVPHRNHGTPDLPQELDFDRSADAVRGSAHRNYPRIPTAIGHCVWVRRDALELVGGFDPAFSPGYGEEVDFSQRCVLHGLTHVAADATLVLHRQGGTFGADAEMSPVQAEHEKIVQQRYPYYDRLQRCVGEDETGPLSRALSAARQAVTGFTVTVDARILGPVVTGTQVHVLELIGALARTGDVVIRAVVPPDLGDYARDALTGLDRVELLDADRVRPGLSRTNATHRPFQVSSRADLEFLRLTGERVIVTQQDLIAYRNPGYHATFAAFTRHRQLTRTALALADRVVFFSEHALRDARAEEIVDPARAAVAHIGVDHVLTGQDVAPVRPAGAERLGSEPFLLCLGTDFRHKNRRFALRVLAALRERHGWQVRLVLAGPRVAIGSSAGDEAELLARHPELDEAVLTLPAISEGEKAWLYANAAGVLYPTVYEGFGLLPFEAAQHGLPCFFASVTSLAELLPPEAATIVPWNPDASADRIVRVLGDADERARHIELISRRARVFTWDQTARELLSIYRGAFRSTYSEAAALAADALEMQREREELELKYNELWSALSEGVHELLGPTGALTRDEQRTLLALLNRRALGAPLRTALRVGAAARRSRETPAREADEAAAERFALHFEYANRVHMREQLRTAVKDGDRDVPDV